MDIIVENIGYLKMESISKLSNFSIYETNKNTHILIKNINYEKVELFYPKKDRLPYKDVEGKKICKGIKVFDSNVNSISEIKTEKWNNGNQILCYKLFCL